MHTFFFAFRFVFLSDSLPPAESSSTFAQNSNDVNTVAYHDRSDEMKEINVNIKIIEWFNCKSLGAGAGFMKRVDLDVQLFSIGLVLRGKFQPALRGGWLGGWLGGWVGGWLETSLDE